MTVPATASTTCLMSYLGSGNNPSPRLCKDCQELLAPPGSTAVAVLPHSPATPLHNLAGRELYVLRLASRGHSNREIAEELAPTVHTDSLQRLVAQPSELRPRERTSTARRGE